MKDYTLLKSVMAEHSHEKTSNKYSFIPTNRVISLLEDNGWFVSDARETNSKRNQGFQKHIIRFRQNKYLGKSLEVEEIIPEAVMINAHDLTSGFIFMSGLEKCWCSNQCTVSEGTMRSHRVTHRGYTDQKVLDAVYNIVDETPLVLDRIDKFKSVQLNADDRFAFGYEAMDLLYKDSKWNDFSKSLSTDRLLKSRRSQDNDNNLWNVFNIVQEKFLQGGRYLISNQEVAYARRYGARTDHLCAEKSRKVKSIDKDIKLNRALWSLAERTGMIASR